MRKCCKECPWLVNSNNNKVFTDHAKKHKKKHNCHMVDNKGDGLWNENPKNQCYGNKKYLENE